MLSYVSNSVCDSHRFMDIIQDGIKQGGWGQVDCSSSSVLQLFGQWDELQLTWCC